MFAFSIIKYEGQPAAFLLFSSWPVLRAKRGAAARRVPASGMSGAGAGHRRLWPFRGARPAGQRRCRPTYRQHLPAASPFCARRGAPEAGAGRMPVSRKAVQGVPPGRPPARERDSVNGALLGLPRC